MDGAPRGRRRRARSRPASDPRQAVSRRSRLSFPSPSRWPITPGGSPTASTPRGPPGPRSGGRSSASRAERARAALQDMSRWLRYASAPGNAAFAKWVLFLSDIYVVASEKVQQPNLIWRHNDILAAGPRAHPVPRQGRRPLPGDDHLPRPEPEPARGAERELREGALRTLPPRGGQLHRARHQGGGPGLHGIPLRRPGRRGISPSDSTTTGGRRSSARSGRFDGAQVIDLAYRLPAAGAFFPHELVKFYLSDTMLPADYLHALGDRWRTEGGYDLRWLALRLFGSRIFFAPEFRGNFIKSPLQYYLGMVQDLGLELPRFQGSSSIRSGRPARSCTTLRTSGGRAGGRTWINSGSLSARRRTLVEQLFAEPRRKPAQRRRAARPRGRPGRRYREVRRRRRRPRTLCGPFAGPGRRGAQEILLPILPAEPGFAAALEHFVGRAEPGTPERLRRIRRATASLLESPAYHLC